MTLLTRRGVLVEDMGQTWLAEPQAEGEEARTLRPLQAAAVTYRIAFGPRAGQKVLTLRGAVPREATARQPLCADIDGFSLHAAVPDERVQLNAAGQVELKLKTPWRDGTTHLVMSPLEFMQRLAARATEGCSSGTRAAAAAASHPVPWGAGTQRQAAVMGRAAGTRGARAGQRRRHGQQRRGRGGSGPGPAAPHRLGAAAQAGL